ncbi:hypothetical protein U1763_20220 [Sphingomonas sp. LB2R24]|uniref:hypothetical protein n=1 Tax=Sphingomonas sorbitolis TaxID=3096165 RepID=UPI002FC6470C
MKALANLAVHGLGEFARYFIYVGYPLYAFSVLKSLGKSAALVDIVILIILTGIGSFFLANQLGRAAAAIEKKR